MMKPPFVGADHSPRTALNVPRLGRQSTARSPRPPRLPAKGFVSDADRCTSLRTSLVHDGGRCACCVRRARHGNSAVRLLQRRGVIDPIARHPDDVSTLLKRVDAVKLVLGKCLDEAIGAVDRVGHLPGFMTLDAAQAADRTGALPICKPLQNACAPTSSCTASLVHGKAGRRPSRSGLMMGGHRHQPAPSRHPSCVGSHANPRQRSLSWMPICPP